MSLRVGRRKPLRREADATDSACLRRHSHPDCRSPLTLIVARQASLPCTVAAYEAFADEGMFAAEPAWAAVEAVYLSL
jgi:hypothetical protein